MVALLPADQAFGERPGELGEAFQAAVEEPRGDLALVEQLLADRVAPVHPPPPGEASLAGSLFSLSLEPLNRSPTAEVGTPFSPVLAGTR
jgi:hypothetical protein